MEQERKTENLHIRLTPTDKKKITEHANMMNLSVSDYFTFVFSKKRIIVCDNFRDLVYQIGRIGNNINQIAAIANKNHYISANNINETKKQLQECQQSINKFIAYAYESDSSFTENDSVQSTIILEEVVTTLHILSNRIESMDGRMEKMETKLGM